MTTPSQSPAVAECEHLNYEINTEASPWRMKCLACGATRTCSQHTVDAFEWEPAVAEVVTPLDSAALLAEVERLKGIVEKLPVTADGVPIVYGMEVWYWDEEEDPPRDATWDSRGDFVKTTINGVFAKNFKEYAGEVTVSVAADSWEGGNGDVYSTREAALASMKAEKEGKVTDAR